MKQMVMNILLLLPLLFNLMKISYCQQYLSEGANGNNMDQLYKGPSVPHRTKVNLMSQSLIRIPDDTTPSVDLYIAMLLQGSDYQQMNLIHPSNSSLGIYASGIKASVYEIDDYPLNKTSIFILKVPNFPTQLARLCYLVFEGIQLFKPGVQSTILITPDITRARNVSLIQQSLLQFKISFFNNPYWLNGVPLRYTLQGISDSGQPTGIYTGVTLLPTIYLSLPNISQFPNYNLYITVFEHPQSNPVLYPFTNPKNVTITDGQYSFTSIMLDGRMITAKVSQLAGILFLESNYTLIVTLPSTLISLQALYAQSGIGMQVGYCESFNTNCLFIDEDFIFYPPIQVIPPIGRNNFTVTINSPTSLPINQDFAFQFSVVTDPTVAFQQAIVGINFPQEFADQNQDSFGNGGYPKLGRTYKVHNIDRKDPNFPLPPEYTIIVLLPFLDATNFTLNFPKLRGMNRAFTTNNLKFCFGVMSSLFTFVPYTEIQSSISLSFIPSTIRAFNVVPYFSGIRVLSNYTFTVDLGYFVNYDSYLTIQIPAIIQVLDTPKVQSSSFPANLDPYCAPYYQITNNTVTVSNFICPNYSSSLQAAVKNVLLPITISSMLTNPTQAGTQTFQVDLYEKNADQQAIYGDQTYYHIQSATVQFSYIFTTKATGVCQSKVQYLGVICDKLLITLYSNSGIYSSEQIVLTFPPEIIPSIDFVDNNGTPYVNNISCSLISFLPTSTCSVDTVTHTITIKDTQFSNNIYQTVKQVLMYNTLIPRYMNPLTTQTAPFPANVTPFSFIVQDYTTLVNSSTQQIIDIDSFYAYLPINQFQNLQASQVVNSLGFAQNSIFIQFQIITQLHSGDLLQILLPNYFDFTKATLTSRGPVVSNQSFSFTPHPTYSTVTILQFTISQTITDFATLNTVLITNVINSSTMPNFSTGQVVNNYTLLTDMLIQIIDNQSQKPFYSSVINGCFTLSSTEAMVIESISLEARGVYTQNAIYGEKCVLTILVSIQRLQLQEQYRYLDLLLNLPIIDQSTIGQLQISINQELYTDYLVISDSNYINAFRFTSFPYVIANTKQYYSIELSNVSSIKQLVVNQPQNVKVQRVLSVTQNGTGSTINLDSSTLSKSYSIQCDSSCLTCINVSTFCTSCTPDRELHPTIPGKCIATIASKLLNVVVIPPSSEESLINYNSMNDSQLLVSGTVNIYFQFQAYISTISSFYFSIQIPNIFSSSTTSANGIQFDYGQDISSDASDFQMSNQQSYAFTTSTSGDFLVITTSIPILLIQTLRHIIKISYVQLPNSSLTNFPTTFSVLIKDEMDPTLVRRKNDFSLNLNVVCGTVCKTCQGNPSSCTSCYDGDYFDQLGKLCISRTCWDGEIKVLTSSGFQCVRDDKTQNCSIPYCLYCDPNSSTPKCLKCFINFNLSPPHDKCLFKNPNVNDSVSISNSEQPFGGKVANTTEQSNSTQSIEDEMDKRDLWSPVPQPVIVPNIKLYVPLGILVSLTVVIYSIFNNLTQTGNSFSVDVSSSLGLLDMVLGFYYAQRFGGIPSLEWWHISQTILLVVKFISQIIFGNYLYRKFREQLYSMTILDDYILRLISFRQFFKIQQDQYKMNKLQRIKSRPINRTDNNNNNHSNQNYNQSNQGNEDEDDVLDYSNPNCMNLERVNSFYFISICINLVYVLLYMFSRIQYAEVYDASYSLTTLSYEYTFFYSFMMIFDLIIVIKNMVTMGTFLNINEPYEYNFKQVGGLADDLGLNNSNTGNDGQHLNNQQNYQSISYDNESGQEDDESQSQPSQGAVAETVGEEDTLKRMSSCSQIPNKTDSQQLAQRRNSWPQIIQKEESQTLTITISSNFEKGQKKFSHVQYKETKQSEVKENSNDIVNLETGKCNVRARFSEIKNESDDISSFQFG